EKLSQSSKGVLASALARRNASPGQPSMIFTTANWNLQFFKLIVERKTSSHTPNHLLVLTFH
uniref:Uncharacterized protein n=1 Tax=Ursus americanus TaxID=9643 RepID=A0A452QVX7_URSAM